MSAETKTLHVSYRAGNGKRLARDFQIPAHHADEPEARAKHITNASFYGIGRGWTLVNWEVRT